MARREQPFDQVRTDEPGTAGYQHARFAALGEVTHEEGRRYQPLLFWPGSAPGWRWSHRVPAALPKRWQSPQPAFGGKPNCRSNRLRAHSTNSRLRSELPGVAVRG